MSSNRAKDRPFVLNAVALVAQQSMQEVAGPTLAPHFFTILQSTVEDVSSIDNSMTTMLPAKERNVSAEASGFGGQLVVKPKEWTKVYAAMEGTG